MTDTDTVDVALEETLDGVVDLPASMTPNVDAYYGHLQSYVRMVAHGMKDALMLNSPAGLGKSYQITSVLEEELGEHGYVIQSGYCSPLELFHSLYDAQLDTVLFLDDIEGLLGDDRCLALLKQATWGRGKGEDRYVEWKSTSDKVEVPNEFEFEGRIIMSFNEVPDNPIFKSLRSRALYYELDFTYDERLEIIREIAKAPYKGLTLADRREVAEWICENTSPNMDIESIDLRFMIHCFDLFRFEEDTWQSRAEELMESMQVLSHDDLSPEERTHVEHRRIVAELLEKHDTVNDAIEEFIEETGASRRTFFRRKEELK